jgi:uncharacterized protein
MTILPISLTLAAVAALINLWLMIRVGRVRTREKVMVGDGGNDAVIRRMRAHSNYIESTAFVLLLVFLIEMAAGTSTWLWAVGGIYFAGRIAHAIGMDGMMKARFVGTIVTLITQLLLAGMAIYISFMTPTSATDTMAQSIVAADAASQ